ncbi:protein translocase subunit SecD [Leptospira ognonensis]|uniref:Protein translocase subunit SecD n=1 Tax=Leptospira ognonensis TaxID=2484945 RepID=A0A4R9KF78_9LEPT|nr:protein translocase subunit SecD [Leptospira ognonensis]TGL63862.1 protein translocase subunit SecD [Leptospira ognonensis]
MRSFSLLLIPAFIIAVSFTILYPNFADRTLNLAVLPEVYNLAPETQEKLTKDFFDRWQRDYGLTSQWTIEPNSGLPPKEMPVYKIRGRFITSAKINQISQENQGLVWESKNKLEPTMIEDMIKGGKSLSIKLGLDLQGGMRVVLKGDFDDYAKKLRDIYAREIADQNAILLDAKKSEDEKKKANERLAEINSNFELSPMRKLVELEKAKMIIDNRLTSQNLTEPQVRIQKEQDAIEVSLPGVTNSAAILEILQNTETVEYRIEEPSPYALRSRIEESERKWMELGKREETDIFKFQEIVKNKLGKKAQDAFIESLEKKYNIPPEYKIFAYWRRGESTKSALLPRSFTVLERKISLSGNDMTNAQPSFNSNSYGWMVSFTLTPNGAEKFFDLTSQNRGRNLSIVWGDKVVSNPVINEPIAGGRAEISGSFSQEEAIRLANVISEGALPIPLSVLEMRFIGPTLGIESIEVGIRAVVIGFFLVMLYMILYYRLGGLVADISLLANIIILAALLTLMDFTLTLPGFAGVILTVGMAVDANVIIYERIREEIEVGRPLSIAVTQGFENAFWTIMDANLTTLIAGILMIRLGNGPIKGFAITLCWGIVTTLFTSLFLSRMFVELLVNRVGVRHLNLRPFFFGKTEVTHV